MVRVVHDLRLCPRMAGHQEPSVPPNQGGLGGSALSHRHSLPEVGLFAAGL